MAAPILQIPVGDLLSDAQLTRCAALQQAALALHTEVPAPQIKPLGTDTPDLLLVANYIVTGTDDFVRGE